MCRGQEGCDDERRLNNKSAELKSLLHSFMWHPHGSVFLLQKCGLLKQFKRQFGNAPLSLLEKWQINPQSSRIKLSRGGFFECFIPYSVIFNPICRAHVCGCPPWTKVLITNPLFTTILRWLGLIWPGRQLPEKKRNNLVCHVIDRTRILCCSYTYSQRAPANIGSASYLRLLNEKQPHKPSAVM